MVSRLVFTSFSQTMTDQCTIDANGNLKDASGIVFYESESDAKAIPANMNGECPSVLIFRPPGSAVAVERTFSGG